MDTQTSNKKHITIEQLKEIHTGDYVWLQIKMMGFRSFRNQDSMDKQVSKYCTVKNLKEFLERFQEPVKTNDIDWLWEKVKEVVKRNNR